MAEPAQKVIPGAPSTISAKSASKKKKQPQQQKQGNTNGAQTSPKDAVSQAATAATLMEKAPSKDKVDESVKIQAKDLAEEAERHGAIAAAEIVKEKESEKAGSSAERESKSALLTILAKRVKILSKKLQRAVTYEALEEERLNTDMKRIIASKPALEASVAELTEAAKAVEIAEQEASKNASHQSRLAVEAAKNALITEHEKRIATLCQFLHLYSLTQPSVIPTFAPISLPAVLEQATSQEVGAIAKLYADLSSNTEVVSQDVKSTLIEKLASGSEDDVVKGVTFQHINAMLEGLSSPSVLVQPGQDRDVKVEAETQAVHANGSIEFLQSSEIDDATEASNALEAIEDVKQAEPEGGAADGIPSSELKGGASVKGVESGKGSILGQEAGGQSQLQGEHDGSAKAQVEEPIQTTEITNATGSVEADDKAAKKADELFQSGPKVIDWANDDDDWGDMMMQPTSSAKAPTDAVIAAPVNTTSNGSTLNPAEKGGATNTPGKKASHTNGSNGKMNGDVQKGQPAHHQRERSSGQQRIATQQQQQKPQQETAAVKGAGEVDEDGFETVASSKRTKMLQQQQQQYAGRGNNRGGRGGGGGGGGGSSRTGRGGFLHDGGNKSHGGGNGGGKSGGGQARGGGLLSDGRGRGKSRAGRLDQASEV
ncbi:hypothetical protein CBS101457_003799 [Exobasidium rhododendri]|nr:hypothetical protein CBS101457_003799 [Exobasidium rhododendri]